MFLTSFLSDVFQPRFFQPFRYSKTPFITYWLSVWMVTSQRPLMAVSPSITACISMRLLVVQPLPPESSFSCLP